MGGVIGRGEREGGEVGGVIGRGERVERGV